MMNIRSGLEDNRLEELFLCQTNDVDSSDDRSVSSLNLEFDSGCQDTHKEPTSLHKLLCRYYPDIYGRFYTSDGVLKNTHICNLLESLNSLHLSQLSQLQFDLKDSDSRYKSACKEIYKLRQDAARNEDRITELHSVIAELQQRKSSGSRRESSASAGSLHNIIEDEQECNVSELSQVVADLESVIRKGNTSDLSELLSKVRSSIDIINLLEQSSDSCYQHAGMILSLHIDELQTTVETLKSELRISQLNLLESKDTADQQSLELSRCEFELSGLRLGLSTCTQALHAAERELEQRRQHNGDDSDSSSDDSDCADYRSAMSEWRRACLNIPSPNTQIYSKSTDEESGSHSYETCRSSLLQDQATTSAELETAVLLHQVCLLKQENAQLLSKIKCPKVSKETPI